MIDWEISPDDLILPGRPQLPMPPDEFAEPSSEEIYKKRQKKAPTSQEDSPVPDTPNDSVASTTEQALVKNTIWKWLQRRSSDYPTAEKYLRTTWPRFVLISQKMKTTTN